MSNSRPKIYSFRVSDEQKASIHRLRAKGLIVGTHLRAALDSYLTDTDPEYMEDKRSKIMLERKSQEMEEK